MIMDNDLGNLIELHGWEINQQSFLDIKGTDYTVSVIPEYTFYTRDEYNKICYSVIPQGLTLNICVYNRISGGSKLYVHIDSEEEFIDFMVGIQKQIKTEEVWES